jgi:hypothetical protein
MWLTEQHRTILNAEAFLGDQNETRLLGLAISTALWWWDWQKLEHARRKQTSFIRGKRGPWTVDDWPWTIERGPWTTAGKQYVQYPVMELDWQRKNETWLIWLTSYFDSSVSPSQGGRESWFFPRRSDFQRTKDRPFAFPKQFVHCVPQMFHNNLGNLDPYCEWSVYSPTLIHPDHPNREWSHRHMIYRLEGHLDTLLDSKWLLADVCIVTNGSKQKHCVFYWCCLQWNIIVFQLTYYLAIHKLNLILDLRMKIRPKQGSSYALPRKTPHVVILEL